MEAAAEWRLSAEGGLGVRWRPNFFCRVGMGGDGSLLTFRKRREEGGGKKKDGRQREGERENERERNVCVCVNCLTKPDTITVITQTLWLTHSRAITDAFTFHSE